MKNLKLSADSLQEDQYLYLCDGKACKESDKICCFTQGFDCKHASDKSHAIHPDNSIWVPLDEPETHIFVEPDLGDKQINSEQI